MEPRKKYSLKHQENSDFPAIGFPLHGYQKPPKSKINQALENIRLR